MSKLEIRRILPADMDLWFKMRIESLYDSPSAFLASPETELARGIESFRERISKGGDDNVIFACFDGAQIVGSVGLVRESHLKAKHKGTIWGMYLRPEYRGKQIGKKLIQTAIDFARDRMKLKKVDLSVEASRDSAKRLYSSMGFQQWGREKFAMQIDGKYYDEEYMSLIF